MRLPLKVKFIILLLTVTLSMSVAYTSLSNYSTHYVPEPPPVAFIPPQSASNATEATSQTQPLITLPPPPSPFPTRSPAPSSPIPTISPTPSLTPTPSSKANPTPQIIISLPAISEPTENPTPIPFETPTTEAPTPSVMPTSEPFLTPSPSSIPTPTPIAAPSSTPTPESPSESPTPNPIPSPNPTLSPLPSSEFLIIKATNWAGYTAAVDYQTLQSNVTAVSASWTVPAITVSESNTYSSVWIGIGGLSTDQTLIQCGTAQESINGQLRYSAWYEVLPAYSIPILNMNVAPGDQIHAFIQLSNAELNQWTINITDSTSRRTFQRTVEYESSQACADWIVERPNVNNQTTTLANFTTCTFTNCSATIQGINVEITDLNLRQVVMYFVGDDKSNPIQLTEVSKLDEDDLGFSVDYLRSY